MVQRVCCFLFSLSTSSPRSVKRLLNSPWSVAFFFISAPTIARVPYTHLHMMAMAVLLGFLMMKTQQIDGSTAHCPSNCSTFSPLPYPFRAKPGCGSPGFQLTNCSILAPLWNLAPGAEGTPNPYYLGSIGPHPNYSNPHPGPIPNYGYGGTARLLINYTTPSHPALCEVRSGLRTNNFSTAYFYAFEDADLTFYQTHFFFLNCTQSMAGSQLDSGILTPSSPSCSKFMKNCSFNTTGICLDYVPDKELQVVAIVTLFGCSSATRFLIADVDAPVSTWVSATQIAWGPVQHADSCSSCQISGGECGYDVRDHSRFQCYCEDGIRDVNCQAGGQSGKRIGIGVGVSIAILFILLGGAGVACYSRHKDLHSTLFLKGRRKLDNISQAPLDFTYGALAGATKSFSTMIGHGAFGKVYRGVLSNNNVVAVKVLDPAMSHADEQFMNEVATIGNIHHMNVARLIGFCFQRSKRILVYEYVSNGSLDKYLFPSKQPAASTGIVLSWKQRYDIALGIARGLSYMHQECRHYIIHCDIKPQNILLDASFCPKISDFGLARLLTREESRILTRAQGTPGYVAPEFWSLGSGPLTTKFDVYSYGVVLLEIIGGRRCFDMLDAAFQGQEDEVGSWMCISVDKQVELDEADVEQVKVCTLVALWCIQENPALRPSMNRVVQYLQGTAILPENPPKPFKRFFQTQDVNGRMPLHSSDSHVSSYEGGLSITCH